MSCAPSLYYSFIYVHKIIIITTHSAPDGAPGCADKTHGTQDYNNLVFGPKTKRDVMGEFRNLVCSRSILSVVVNRARARDLFVLGDAQMVCCV